MVCYHVLVSDELLAQDPDFSLVGLRLIEESALSIYPGMRWWKVEEPDGPPELEGKQVELWLQTIVDVPQNPIDFVVPARYRIADRRVIGPKP